MVQFYLLFWYSSSMRLPFAGKTALIIGGSGGIGRAVALGLAERGANLIIHGGNSGERLENTLAEVRVRASAAAGQATGTVSAKTAAAVSGFLWDIDLAGPEKSVEFILSRANSGGGPSLCSGPDLLVCAWGPFKKVPLTETSPQIWRSMTENNLIFPEILISGVLRCMIKKGWGRILLFGGTCTGEIRGFTGTAAYSAAKTALGVLAKSAARAAINAGAFEVSCNILCPGLTDTEYTGESERIFNRDHSPGGKAMNPREIALAALQILENPAINGIILPMDRGISIKGFDKTVEKG
jgi:3-oxoacyl-[acyl-carrier protein] reductase